MRIGALKTLAAYTAVIHRMRAASAQVQVKFACRGRHCHGMNIVYNSNHYHVVECPGVGWVCLS